jgi:hypothetical protein
MNEYERRLVEGTGYTWIGSNRLSQFVKYASVVAGLVLTLLPVGLLYFHTADWEKWSKLGLIAGFTILFTVFLKVSTKTSTQEVLSYSSG